MYQYTSQGGGNGNSLLLEPVFISEALGLWKAILETSKRVTLVECLSLGSLCTISTQSRDRVLAVTWTTFGKVAGWESLASHWLRLHHTYKVQAGGADEDLVKSCKPMSGLLTTSTRELATVCSSCHLRDTI